MRIPERASYAEIDLAAFRWNFGEIEKKVAPAKIAAVVKANAYGHGMLRIAREAVKLGAEYLCVAYVQEGLELRAAGIDAPVMVFIPPLEHEIQPALENGLELIVCSADAAEKIAAHARVLKKRAKVQVNVDTGMHRTGINWEHAPAELKKIAKIGELKIQGIYTHFATSDWTDLTFAKEQLRRFRSVLDRLTVSVPVIHAANSGAVLQIEDSFFTMVRPGVSLYGCYPSMLCRRTLSLKPVMKVISFAQHVREYRQGERFGYSGTFTSESDTKVVTVPVGYADGINRLLSNKGHVLIRGRKYRIVGLVSMDSILVEVGADSDVREGDEVVLLGKQKYREISVNDWCEILHTIPYEVTCNISARMPRRFVNEE